MADEIDPIGPLSSSHSLMMFTKVVGPNVLEDGLSTRKG